MLGCLGGGAGGAGEPLCLLNPGVDSENSRWGPWEWLQVRAQKDRPPYWGRGWPQRGRGWTNLRWRGSRFSLHQSQRAYIEGNHQVCQDSRHRECVC